MCWLLRRRSALSTHNKLVLYKQTLKPVWTYGIQLWGSTKPSTAAIIQFPKQNPPQHRWCTLVRTEYWPPSGPQHGNGYGGHRRFAWKHEERFLRHENFEAIKLLDNSELLRRLQRTKPADLVSWTLHPEYRVVYRTRLTTDGVW
jgi:hypothetical protein